jgi:hypothetical protein
MASLISRLIGLIRPRIDAKAFYAGKTISEVEWWISSCCEFPELYWGRLRVFSDGTADAAFDESSVYGFDDRKYAGYFLGEDEYVPFATLDADDEKQLGAKQSEISPPPWRDKATEFKYLGTYGQAIEHGVGPERRSPNS